MGRGNPLTVRGVELPRDNYGLETDTMRADPIRQYEVDYAEAVRLIKRSSGRSIFVRAGQFGVSKVQQGDGKTRGFDISGNVETTKRHALHYLDGAYGERMRKEVNLRVSICSNCLFIG